eukprot:940342_1
MVFATCVPDTTTRYDGTTITAHDLRVYRWDYGDRQWGRLIVIMQIFLDVPQSNLVKHAMTTKQTVYHQANIMCVWIYRAELVALTYYRWRVGTMEQLNLPHW